MRVYTQEEMNDICTMISDIMADWLHRNKLTLSEQLLAELIEAIIVQTLRIENNKNRELELKKSYIPYEND